MFRKVQVILAGAAPLLLLAGCGMGGANVRMADGRLADCSAAPHCVASIATDEDHRVEPFHYTGSAEAAQKALAKIISASGSGVVVENTPGYMRAEYTSQLFGYVDDVEFLLQDDRVIQVRSSSRIGYYDFGANRKHIEDIRKLFDAVQP